MQQFLGLQRTTHDLATEQQQKACRETAEVYRKTYSRDNWKLETGISFFKKKSRRKKAFPGKYDY